MSSFGVFELEGVGDAVGDGLGVTGGVAAPTAADRERPGPGREDNERNRWSHADLSGRSAALEVGACPCSEVRRATSLSAW